MNAHRTLLVALDFGPHTQSVLSEALTIADLLNAKIHLLHVFTLRDKRELAPLSQTTSAYLKNAEHLQLQAAKARCSLRGRLGTVLWHEGDPTAQILHAAEALNADLILIGASSRSARKRARLGCVAEAVIRRAPCTVMVVREKHATVEPN